MKLRQFKWLEKEISEVKTRKFFDVDGTASDDLRRAVESSNIPVPDSYKAFVLQFGNSKLYKQQAGYAVGVRAAPVEAISRDGEPLLCFGHYQDRQAFFKVDLLKEGDESPVFESQQGGLKMVADGFAQWLTMRCAAVRKAIGARRWGQIVGGPSPFTERETAIVEARRAYTWRIIGTDDNGDVLFEIYNGSKIVLPFFSVGIRHKKGGFSGTVWLPVSQIEPGSTAVVRHECYKRHIEQIDLEAYELPDPEPEDKLSYWEFKEPSLG
ncbi:hypothetical protein HYR99_20165 [Candidatus Poribacteria bacterium]|nr:hypothetical protein [Candidatus Poribacteria bacterium]